MKTIALLFSGILYGIDAFACVARPVHVNFAGTNFTGDNGLTLSSGGIVFKDRNGTPITMNFKGGMWCYVSHPTGAANKTVEEHCLSAGTAMNFTGANKVLGRGVIESDGTLRIQNGPGEGGMNSARIVIRPKPDGYSIHFEPCQNGKFSLCMGQTLSWTTASGARQPRGIESEPNPSLDTIEMSTGWGGVGGYSVSQCGIISKNELRDERTLSDNAGNTDAAR